MSPVDRADLRRRVDQALTAFLGRQRRRLTAIDPAIEPVAEALEAFVLGGGKRLRPAFGYWGYRAAGGADTETVVAGLSALELVQASALIHDDLMDASDTRRGEPAVHRRFAGLHLANGWHGDPDGFGTASAVLLGDLCLAWSDEILHGSGLDQEAVARARPIFDEMRTEVIAGQYLDVLTQATGDTSLDRAVTVARYKAAKYTVERPLLIGAALAGAPDEVFVAYSGFGLPLGEAFQLRDDILGVFGDPLATGKPAGDDLREGKRTYLVAAAFETAVEADREVLIRGLGDRKLSGTALAELRGVIERTGAVARTEARITQLTSTALEVLGTVDLDPEGARMLTALATAATHRTG